MSRSNSTWKPSFSEIRARGPSFVRREDLAWDGVGIRAFKTEKQMFGALDWGWKGRDVAEECLDRSSQTSIGDGRASRRAAQRKVS